MAGFIIRRILWLIPVIIFVSGITFVLMHLTPGGPWDTASGKFVSPAVKLAIQQKYGLDKPLPVQYADYMTQAIQGHLGPSFSMRGRTVDSIIADGFPVTAALGLAALSIAIIIGIPLGILAALRHNSLLDQGSLFLVTLGISVPNFVIGITAIIIFAVTLRGPDGKSLLPFQFYLDQPTSWIMPAVVLALGPLALLVRLTRSATLEVLSEDYVRTARAKGLSSMTINRRHVLRNALIPVVTLLGPLTAGLVTGSFIVEHIFGVPGIGRTFVDSINKRDYALLMGTTLFYTLLVVFFNLLVDLTYSFIDPRIARS